MDVAISFRKSDLTNFTEFWLEVTKHAPEGEVTYRYGGDEGEELEERPSTWVAHFKHIFAKEMGVYVEARLYAKKDDGQVYMSPAKGTTIQEYLLGRLTSTQNLSDTQRTMCADMLNYGAAAQMFLGYDTEHPVNQNLTEEQAAKLEQYATQGLPLVEKTNSNYRPDGASNNLFLSVLLQNRVVLQFKVVANETDEVKVLVKDHATGEVRYTLDTVYEGGYHLVDFQELSAKAMRTEFDFVAQVNGAEPGNIRTWSLEGYVGEVRNGNLPLKTAVVNAMLTYGDSVYANFGDE